MQNGFSTSPPSSPTHHISPPTHPPDFATYVDVEDDAPEEYKKEVIAHARLHKVKVIVSHHNYECTPSRLAMLSTIEACFQDGADIAKIAVMSKSPEDATQVLSLYDGVRPIVALGMGSFGQVTRKFAGYLGAPFTFVSFSKETATAPGQLDKDAMWEFYKSNSFTPVG